MVTRPSSQSPFQKSIFGNSIQDFTQNQISKLPHQNLNSLQLFKQNAEAHLKLCETSEMEFLQKLQMAETH